MIAQTSAGLVEVGLVEWMFAWVSACWVEQIVAKTVG